MKKVRFNAILLLVLSSLVFFACDKNDVEKKNELRFDDKSFDLSWGIIDNYGKFSPEDNTYNFDLLLLSEGLEYVDSIEDIIGKGSGIYFEMFSESSTELLPGKYVLDTTNTIMQPFTFDYAELVYNFDTETEDGDFIELKSGSVEIAKSGEEYEISFEGKGENGENISGYYKGSLKYFDWSEAKKSALNQKNNLFK